MSAPGKDSLRPSASFFNLQSWNDALGIFCSLFVLTPYYQWRHDHAVHHTTAGDLDRRGIGDITTQTVREYLARSRWEQLTYRLYRHPLILFGVGPLYELRWLERLRIPGLFDSKQMSPSSDWTQIAYALPNARSSQDCSSAPSVSP